MQTYTYKRHWKFVLLIFAFIIGIISLTYTAKLVKKMDAEERKSMEIWAEAISYFASTETQGQFENIKFYEKIISQNTTIPVILCDTHDSIYSAHNFSDRQEKDKSYLKKRIEKMAKQHEPIVIYLPAGKKNTLYYGDSAILRQLSIYPYVQLGVISVFIAIAYFAFSSSRKAEQNRVWVGMAKETAHQLGTPISSLMAWIEILSENEQKGSYYKEMQKDVLRLQTVAERFSKIGSIPELPLSDLARVLKKSVNYMQTRISDKIRIELVFENFEKLVLPLNASLFNWVIENILKNAVDAIQDSGMIKISVLQLERQASIRISDTGKGISKRKQKVIFKPGYTSKKRGWGLGLSLVKRIIEGYHKGKIVVESSEINKGTTFKITLPIT